MVTTGRIADRIVDPAGGQGETIEELIAEGEWYGMQTFDQSLFSLYKNGLVTLPDAMAGASNPHDFQLVPPASRPGRQRLRRPPAPDCDGSRPYPLCPISKDAVSAWPAVTPERRCGVAVGEESWRDPAVLDALSRASIEALTQRPPPPPSSRWSAAIPVRRRYRSPVPNGHTPATPICPPAPH